MFGIVNEQFMETKYETPVPIEVRIAALNFATTCANNGECGKTPDEITNLANKVISDYFKYTKTK